MHHYATTNAVAFVDHLLLPGGSFMKKEWIKPELIVLLQGKAEESVLTFCKAVTIAGDPTLNQGGQLCGNDKINSCQNCHSRPPKDS